MSTLLGPQYFVLLSPKRENRLKLLTSGTNDCEYGFQSAVCAVLQRDETCEGRIISGEFANKITRKKGSGW